MSRPVKGFKRAKINRQLGRNERRILSSLVTDPLDVDGREALWERRCALLFERETLR